LTRIAQGLGHDAGEVVAVGAGEDLQQPCEGGAMTRSLRWSWLGDANGGANMGRALAGRSSGGKAWHRCGNSKGWLGLRNHNSGGVERVGEASWALHV